METETVTIPRMEYENLKILAKIDMDFLQQMMSSFKDIKEGRIRKIK